MSREDVDSTLNNKSNVSDIISGCQVFVWLGCLVARLIAWLAVWLPGCMGFSRMSRAIVLPGRELVSRGRVNFNIKTTWAVSDT